MKTKIWLATTLATFLFIASAQAASTLTPKGFSAKPTFPNKNNPEQFTYQVLPGGQIKDTISVSNNEDSPISVNLYSTDSIVQDGKTSFKLESDDQQELGQWVTLEKTHFDVPAHTTEDINFEINVPDTVQTKDFLGGISTEVSSPTVKDGQNITTKFRIINKINLQVTDDPQPIEKMSPTPLVGSPTIAQIYLYGSIALFVIVVGYIAVQGIKKRKS